MAGVRRVTRSILRYLYPLYVLLIVLQVYFAGEGIFGARDTDTPIEDAHQLELHRGFGFFIAQPGALILLILALLAWFRNTRGACALDRVPDPPDRAVPAPGAEPLDLRVAPGERVHPPRHGRVPLVDVLAGRRARG